MSVNRSDVELRIPAQSVYLSVLRTATAGLAARLDFTLDDIEDLRIAVDEACAMVLPQARPDSDLTCSFDLLPTRLTVSVTAECDTPEMPDRGSFAWTVLAALTNEVRADVVGDLLTVTPGPRDDGLGLTVVARAGSDLLAVRARSADLFARLAEESTTAAERTTYRDDLVHLHLPLVEHFARRFLNRGEPFDDLLQVGTIGLIKAIDRFDTARGVEFSTYATPTIVGEIKRHFRDRGWAIRVPRRLQELRISITSATAELTQDLGRSPTVSELAFRLGVSDEEVLEGLESANAYATLSLDAQESGDDSALSMIDVIGGDDEALQHVENRETIKPLLEALDPREKHILTLRFFRGMTQSQIAAEIGISQMHVSRLLARTLERLRDSLDEAPPPGR